MTRTELINKYVEEIIQHTFKSYSGFDDVWWAVDNDCHENIKAEISTILNEMIMEIEK